MTNAKESSQYRINAGVPQGMVWSPMQFVCLSTPIARSSLVVVTTDDSTLLKTVPSKEAHTLAA